MIPCENEYDNVILNSNVACWFLIHFFFFQAEDGIRDRNVTGVQTCALPISFSAPRGLMTGIFFALIGSIILNSFLHIGFVGVLIGLGIGALGVFTLVYSTSAVLRSEERRVGKECRSRWSRGQRKEQWRIACE